MILVLNMCLKNLNISNHHNCSGHVLDGQEHDREELNMTISFLASYVDDGAWEVMPRG
jgi:hypothetical protein